MKLILSLGLRNLLRNKRRNILLGTAIAFGMTILITANSFSRGISDILLNKMIVYMTGHMDVSLHEKSKHQLSIIRDKEKVIKAVKENIDGVKEIVENVFTFARVVGNKKSENMVLVGFKTDEKEMSSEEFKDFFETKLIQGDIKDINNKEYENPVIVYSDKLDSLNVKLYDLLKVRVTTIYGQVQTARLTIVAVLKSDNMFMSNTLMMNLDVLKNLRGFKPHETGSLQINFENIKNPASVIKKADKLHEILKPNTAYIWGETGGLAKKINSLTMGVSENIFEEKKINLISGRYPSSKEEGECMIEKTFAEKLKIKTGSKIKNQYIAKFDKKQISNDYTITGIFTLENMPHQNLVLLHENDFYKTYFRNMPEILSENELKKENIFIPPVQDTALFSPEYKLLERSSTTENLQKKIRAMQRTKWIGAWLDVRTMFESASAVLELESALNLITFFAVMILFFIILIGVINTLRMTIRERTREIGTIRAVGMQKKEVRNLFLAETFFLSFFSCLFGIVSAFILMHILSLITIETDSVLSMLLYKKRLYFLPAFGSILNFFFLIIGIAVMTAFFPARRAANLSAANALRHYE
ncbi:MAG: ABC transporter permease [Spirochaetia bacterium]|nr:ABC transporter permease [Spirochaetia bacterium]